MHLMIEELSTAAQAIYAAAIAGVLIAAGLQLARRDPDKPHPWR
jgi:hypothetical protein